jgi:hypothetical protein
MATQLKKEYDEESFKKFHLASGDELDPEIFPELYNLSSAFTYQYMVRPTSERSPEFVYIPWQIHKKAAEEEVAFHKWNICWEAGQLRSEIFEEKWPEQWIRKFNDVNLYLLPDTRPKYGAYIPLYHLLPQRTLRYFSLPLLKKGIWPVGLSFDWSLFLLNNYFESRLSKAFAYHVWPLLIRGSTMNKFSKDDPLVVLSHNLDYWLPYVYKVAEERLRSFPRVDFESTAQKEKLHRLRRKMPADIEINRPLKGGTIWAGEADAWQATKELVEFADKEGKLSKIIEAVKSNRVEDDFSNYWSYAREDFERKLYHKRSKTKVAFVQLDDTIPVHGRCSELEEVEENLLWEDFIAFLDRKERKVVVCLRNGVTRASEISKILGYANHSPVSKALKRIREKAKKYLELD